MQTRSTGTRSIQSRRSRWTTTRPAAASH